MDVLCTADLCPVILNATCVFYEGGTLMYTGITTNDSVQTALQKIDAKFGDAMVGYTFTNGVYQSVAGAPVGLGGNLTANTSIGGNFTLTFAGNLQATKHITTGGTASQFVKGDGTLDSTAYQAAGNYITALTGDVIAAGPGSVNASLAVVNSNPGTYGSGSLIPVVTVDNKGRVTALTTTAINVPSGILSFVGDVYGSGTTGSQTTLTLTNVNTNIYTNNTFLKFKVNAKGLVTGATPVTHLDIEAVLGYVPVPETRTISINGVTHDLQSNISWTIATGVSGVTASAPLASSGGATPNISIPKADATNNGYLDNVDWVTFNNKVPTSRTLSINGTTYDLSANRSWTINSMVYPGAGIAVSTGIGWGTSLVDNSVNWNTAYAERISSASAPLSIGSNTISISQANASTNGYLSSTDWTTFNNKQTAGDYITSLTGEATASGPGSATVTLSTSAITGKLLTGVNITGGSVVATDSILEAFGKVQNQINGLVGGSMYKGTWDAATNVPTIVSGVGTTGWYYIVSVPGTTNIDGITDWNLGDWIIFDGVAWQQVDNTDAVVSVNGYTGAVNLVSSDVPEGATNLYYTDSRARGAISLLASGNSGPAAYNSLTGRLTIPVYITTGAQTFFGSKTFNSTLYGAGAQFTGNFVIDGNFETHSTNTYIANDGNKDTSVFIGAAAMGPGFTRNIQIGTGGYSGSTTIISIGVNDPGSANTIYIGSEESTSVFTKGQWFFSDIYAPVAKGYSIPGGTSAQYLTADGGTSTGPDLSGYVPTTRTLTINGTTYDLSANRTWTVSGTMPIGGTAGQILSKIDATDYNTQWIDNFASQVKNTVKLGAILTKGTPVYVSSADGTNMIVSASSNTTEATSSKTFGLLETGGSTNAQVECVTYGLIAGLDTSAATAAGDPVWLGPSGTLLYGLANKPVAPAHLVYIGVVTRKQSNNGEIFVNIQNGFEVEELHDVLITAPKTDGQGLFLQTISGTQLWRNRSIADVLGYTPANDANVVHTTGNETVAGVKTFSNNVKIDGDLYLKQDSTFGAIAGYNAITADAGGFCLRTPTTTIYAYLAFNNLTTYHNYSFPDATGTLALTSDLASYVPTSRTLTINGTTYDLSANRSWTIATSGGTVTSVSGTGTVSGLTLSGTVTTSGNLTLGGTLSLTSGNVTTALGYTPYNSTNPSGYITGITSGMVTTALGYTPYNSSNPAGYITSSGSISGNAATATNSSQLNGLSSTQLFNNMGNGHATYSNANDVGGFGFRYLQGSTNSPNTGSTQYYGVTLGLGNDYSWGTYASQLYWNRTSTGGNPYISVRFQEGGSWGSWSKIYAGYADTAGSASSATNATNATNATYVTHLSGRTDSSSYNVVWASGNPSHMYSCDAVRIASNTGTLYANTFSGTLSGNASSATTLSTNATITGLNFGGVFALTGSGANTGNSTGARLSESYGPYWNCGDSATWHHQIMNGSSLVGISAGGTNYGSGYIYALRNITSTAGNIRSSNWLYSEGNSGWYNDTYGQGLRQVKGNLTYGNVVTYGENYNGWSGYNVNNSTVTNFMQNSSGTVGFYQENNAGWILFWNSGYACWGMGTDATDPSYSLHIPKYGGSNNGWIIWSDRRIKENIKTIDNALDKILSLRGVYYNKIDDPNKERQVGYIAQEVLEVVPELVIYSEELDIYNMNYGPMVSMLTEAVKEHHTKTVAQQAEIDTLKQQVQTLLNHINNGI